MFLHLGLHLLSHTARSAFRLATSENANDEDVPGTGPWSTQQPPYTQGVQVPREFIMNVNEAHRCDNDVTGYDRVILLHPRGELATYTNYPTPITCQHCHNKVITSVEEQFDRCGVCLLIFLLVSFFPLGLCFLCFKNNYDMYIHTCPHCGKVVGSCT